MRRYHPNPSSEVPVSFQLEMKLKNASLFSQSRLETWEIAEQAIHEWIAKNEPEAVAMPSHAGIQWKKLFLPNGTVLRTVFRGKNHHCRVEEDQLLHEGKPTSPNGFANLVGGIRRNAWKVIWILFPQAQTGNWRMTCDPCESPVQSVAAGRQAALARGAAKRQGRPAPNAHRHHAVDAQRKTRNSWKSTSAPPAPLGPTQRGEISSCPNRTICGNKANGSQSEGNRFPTAHPGMLKTISNSQVRVRFSALNN